MPSPPAQEAIACPQWTASFTPRAAARAPARGEPRREHQFLLGGALLVEAFGRSADGELTHLHRLLVHARQVHVGQAGGAAVVVADDRDVLRGVHTRPHERFQQPGGAQVVAREHARGPAAAGQQLPRRPRPGLLRVVTGQDVDARIEAVAAHGPAVALAPLLRTGQGAPVDVGDRPVSVLDEVVRGQPRPVDVGGAHAVDAGRARVLADLHDRDPLRHLREVGGGLTGESDEDHGLAPQPEQFVDGLAAPRGSAASR
ncbi:hypothetical protein GCM10027174_07870 [Salinifilum aidingensis]